ncbi:hypothetical protein QR680_017017 [Steinernema hermaphroditum]|uniref:Uncharacterized protein n=1 Tax=Steinernema hermaphroditum TaxID=289476 RepID=A0AA39LNK4_9BILA|nr:hypothetical protein QR680_017017 [Steinernema hermaphroditum]
MSKSVEAPVAGPAVPAAVSGVEAPPVANAGNVASGIAAVPKADDNKISVDIAKLSTSRSKTGNVGHKKKRGKKCKRNLDPEGIEVWKPEDREYYQKVSIHLRNWKATCRQSQCIRTPITWWQRKRKEMKGHPMYQLEMNAYKKTVADLAAVTNKMENLDLDFNI